jgi:hypothetical protein
MDQMRSTAASFNQNKTKQKTSLTSACVNTTTLDTLTAVTTYNCTKRFRTALSNAKNETSKF